MSFFKNFIREEEGQSMVEYGLLIGLIATLAYVAFRTVGTNLSAGVNTQATTVQTNVK